MACNSSMVALMICFITVLWSRWLVCNSVKNGWRPFVSRKPLQPTWMVCRVACLLLLCATSSRWRYLLSFLSRELRRLLSQQIVSSKMCRCPGKSTTRSGQLVAGTVACQGQPRLWFPLDSLACAGVGFEEPGHV